MTQYNKNREQDNVDYLETVNRSNVSFAYVVTMSIMICICCAVGLYCHQYFGDTNVRGFISTMSWAVASLLLVCINVTQFWSGKENIESTKCVFKRTHGTLPTTPSRLNLTPTKQPGTEKGLP